MLMEHLSSWLSFLFQPSRGPGKKERMMGSRSQVNSCQEKAGKCVAQRRGELGERHYPIFAVDAVTVFFKAVSFIRFSFTFGSF